MADKPWKKHERQAAKVVGSLRKPGSGSQGRSDETRSDSKHERLFVECRTRKKSLMRTWLMEARRLAKKENKTAVLVLREAGKPGAVWCCHQDDLPAAVAEYLLANPEVAAATAERLRAEGVIP